MTHPFIYIQDHDWAGCIVALALSEEDAREMMRGEPNYSEDAPLTSHSIMELGLVHVNLGDL